MTTEQIKENIRRLFNIVNTGDYSSLDEVMSDDFTYRATNGDEAHGLDEYLELMNLYAEGMSNIETELQELFVEGNKCVFLYNVTGTHSGEIFGLEPSNNDIELVTCAFGTCDDDGKLVDVFEVFDNFEFLKQIDALPGELTEMPTGAIQARGR